MPRSLLSLAFYLPQFHRIPENDHWWGPGFTEWTRLDQAVPWYPGHVVRRPAAPLGHYDLLDDGVIEAQFEIAQAHGIDGFLVWDYWLGGGRRLLERPVRKVLAQRLPVKYALAWANHAWEDKMGGRLLAPQHYLGAADYAQYFAECRPHFESDAYVRIDGRPLFYLYRPAAIPDLDVFVQTWRNLAADLGWKGVYLVGDLFDHDSPRPPGLDAYSCSFGFWTNWKKLWLNFAKEKLRTKLGVQTSPQRFDYASLLRGFIPPGAPPDFVPTVVTGWDTTPRHGRNGVIVDGLSAPVFADVLRQVGRHLEKMPDRQRLVLVKSWNEWAEGNLLEPDSHFGTALLDEYLAFTERFRQVDGPTSAPGT